MDEIENMEMYCRDCGWQWTIIHLADVPPLFSERRCPNCRKFSSIQKPPPLRYGESPVFGLMQQITSMDELHKRLYQVYGLPDKPISFAKLEKEPWQNKGWRSTLYCSICDKPWDINCEFHYPGWENLKYFWEWAERDIVE